MSEPRAVIVTGASSGIGAATAVELGRRGLRVALGARRVPRLEQVAKAVEAAGGRPFAHPLDVADATSIERFHAAVEQTLGPVDGVVHNAGMSTLGLLEDATPPELRTQIDVNLLGPMLLSRCTIPGMRRRGRGDLVFVSSENAVRPRPYQVAYTAAKAGLEALARALQMELEGSGVRATVVRVGPTGTEFGARFAPEQLRTALDAWRYWGVQRHLHWMAPQRVARVIADALVAPHDDAHVNLVEVMPSGPRDE